MAKAKITLLDHGPVTFNARGYALKRGESRTITNPADIVYFQSQHGIGVEIMEALPKAPKVSATVSKAGAVPDLVPEVDDPVTGEVTEADLKGMTKSALLQYNIEEKIGAKVDGNMSKSAIVAAILAAKDEGSDADEEPEDEEGAEGDDEDEG